MINGVINVYKEKGFTSHDVVAKLRGILKQKKIGHTGTLDPDATGVLPVCLGRATKLCDMLTDKDKTYKAVMLLGRTTDTQDTSGETLLEEDVCVTEEEIRDIIMSFVGNYDQIPPMYSALKVNGKRLYELAREGKTVERKSRPIVIHNITIEKIEMPYVEFTVSCSKGTYIRTLCHDIGQKAGCGACMAELTRTKVSVFDIDRALTISQIEELVKAQSIDEYIIPVDKMFDMYESVVVKRDFNKLLYNGNKLDITNFTQKYECAHTKPVKVYDEENNFIGIYEYDNKYHNYKPVKIFCDLR